MKNISKLLISTSVLSAMYGCTISNEYDPETFEAYEHGVRVEKEKEQAKNDATCDESFKDDRDGNVYNLVRIYDASLDDGKAHCWFDANLAYNAPKSKCHEDSDNCEKYGRLYQGSQLADVCPEGTHIATYADWNHLVKTKNISKDGAKVLKAIDDDWAMGEADAPSDAFGFAALAGGAYDATDGYISVGEAGYWWLVSGEKMASFSMHRDENDPISVSEESNAKNLYYSVRCVVGDETGPASSADDNTQTPSKEEIKENTKVSITGYAQKGPYAKGAKVSATALNNESELKQVGETFFGTVADEDGKFSIKDAELTSKIAELTVEGQFKSELTGKLTSESVSLKAIVDLSKRDQVNINLLTHLEYDRLFYLVTKKHISFANAKKEAEKGIFKAFYFDIADSVNAEGLNISGSSDADVALLTMSILVLGGNNAGETVALMKSISSDLAEDGTLDNDSIKSRMADWVAEAEINGGVDSIRASLGKNVGAFEKYLSNYWKHVYGIDTVSCASADEGKIVWTDNSSSKYNKNSETRFICKEGRWKFASVLEKNTYKWENGKDGDVRNGSLNSDSVFVFENGAWRIGNVLDSTLKLKGCIEKRANEVSKTEDDVWYLCDAEKTSWVKLNSINSFFTKFTPDDKAEMFNANITYGEPLNDVRDGKVYKTVKIGDQVWMAENLNYADVEKTPNLEGQSWCYDDLDYSCLIAGRLYSWTAAMNLEKKYATTSLSSLSNDSKIQGICPDGWRLPNQDDMDELDSELGTEASEYRLSSKAFWPNSKNYDTFGFSGISSGRRTKSGEFEKAGAMMMLWYANNLGDGFESFAKALYIFDRDEYNQTPYDNDIEAGGNDDKTVGAAVRCIQE